MNRKAMDPNGKWGLYDTKDRVWMGDANGPARYADHMLARLVAEIVSRSCGWPITRVRAKEYDGSGNKHKDDVAVVQPFDQSLRDIERGKI